MQTMRRIVAALAALLCSSVLVGQWTVELDRQPAAGHLWAVGPLPAGTAPILVGPGGVRAYRIETLGTHSALYGLETFAELVPDDGRIPLVPATKEDAVALWWAHPAVLDDPSALAGQVVIGGHVSRGPKWSLVDDGEHRKRFRAVHDVGPYWLNLWLDVWARSPVVHVVGFVARKDRTLELDVPVAIAFGENIAFPLERLHGGRLSVLEGKLSGSIDLDRGTVYPLRFSLLCRRQPARVPGPATDADPPLDDVDEAALAVGANGPSWFMPTEWPTEWLGARVTTPIAAGKRLAAGALESWRAPHRMSDLRPWASMPGASQGGSQPSLALTWFAPALVPARLRPQDVHLWSADDWALRPMLLLELDVPDPLDDLRELGATVASRQVFGIERIGDQVVPTFQTRGGVPVHLPTGNLDHRAPPDELHTADLPLVAAYAMTGDPLARWLLDAVRELDLAQRQVSSSWRSNGRGEGRTLSSMLLASRTMPESVRSEVVAHCLLRLATAVAKADTAHLPETAISRPIELYTDGRLRCRHPALIPYEEAQGAYGFWLLWEQTGDVAALDAAYRFGLTVAATLYQEGGAWRVPYACSQNEDGRPLSSTELRNPELVHPSTWAIHWAGCGLRALIDASVEREVPPEHEAFIERARAAVAWIDAQPLTKVEEIHQALYGARVAPRIPR